MILKTCTKCGRELPLREFHRYNRRNETHYSQCRDCKAEYKRENKEKLLSTQLRRRAKPTPEERQKKKAWNALYYALRVGKITKPDACELCGNKGNMQGHHRDYSKPFDVTWVCQWCHSQLDNQRRLA